jgi:isocitrate/isopropylmalate dehydrogenase
MMRGFLGEFQTAGILNQAVKQRLAERKIRIRDSGGNAKSCGIGDDIVGILQVVK